MKWINSLKQALTLNFVLAAALPLIVFALVTLKYVNDYLEQDVARDNLFLARELRAQTETFLRRPVTVLEHIKDVVHNGKTLIGTSIDAYLEDEVRSSDFFESIYILNRQGRVIHLGVSSKLERQKQDYYSIDLSSHELLQNDLEQGQVYWSNTFISVVTGEPSITIGLPIEDVMLVGNLSLSRLNAIVARFTYVENISFAIIDQRGGLIAHSDPNKALQRFSMMFHPEVSDAIESKGEVALHIHEDGTLMESVVRIPETGWVVWVGRDRNAFLEPVRNVRDFMLLALGLSILVGVMLSILNSRILMRPISILVEGVRRFAGGSQVIDAPKSVYREIAELSDGFKQMSIAVQDRENSILEREERFRSLVNSIEGIVWEYDVGIGEFLFVSEHCEKMLGCHYRQWLDSPEYWINHIHPDDRQWVVDYFNGLRDGKLSPQFEYRMVNTRRETVWVRNMVNVVYESGRPGKLYGVIIDITERKRSEIGLRESELRFRSLVEQAADAIFIHDASGRFVEVNSQACDSLGYGREEILQMRVQDIEAGHDPAHYASLWTTVRHGGSLTLEGEHRRKDGSTFPVEMRVGSFSFQNKPLYLALVRDISERKKADSALRESEERFRNYFELGLIGMSLRDREGRFIQFNDRLCEITGYDRSELAQMTWLDLTHPDDREESIRGMEQLFSGQIRRLSIEKRYIRKNGENVYLSISVIGIRNADGVIDQSIAVADDITERKRAEQALQESEEQVRLLLNSTAEGIYGIDLDGKCTFCNPAGLKLLGFADEGELLGRNMHELIHHSSIDGTKMQEKDCEISRAISASDNVHVDNEVFWRADGSWFHVEYWAHSVLKDSRPIGAVITFHDITDRKLMQQQSIRTAQLASLGELAAGVAHEINNPINGVINYAQILLNRMQKKGLDTDLADRIMKEGERIATIVRDLLFFAREGGPELRTSEVGEVLAESLSLTEAQIRKEGILLRIDIKENLPWITTRAQQVQQLFLNILGNSRHALNEKYPGHDEKKIIEISIGKVMIKDKPYVRTVFKDYGTGIPEALLDKVMNPFVTTKPAGIGTGLGLSISHEIVRNHHGRISINSQEGEWTEVIVDLPASEKGTG